MNNVTSSIAIAILVVAGTACKKDKTKDNAAAESAGAPAAKPAGAPAVAAKPAACPAGFTNPGDVGACIKMPEGMKADDTLKQPGKGKRATFYGEGGASIDLFVDDATDAFWEDNKKNLNGGFGGTPDGAPVKIGEDGLWGQFVVDNGDRKVSASRLRNQTVKVECQAWKDVKSPVGPKLEVMMDVCKSITLP
jgi:hypothetical protein